MVVNQKKVYQVCDEDWVCAMTEEEAVAYYLNETGVRREDLFDDIKDCDIDQTGMWVEYDDSSEIDRLDSEDIKEVIIHKDTENKKGTGFGSVWKKCGQWHIYLPFRDVIHQHYSNTNEPFIIASTEW